MKINRIIIWTGFVVIFSVMFYYGRYFKRADVPGIVSLEMADHGKGQEILSSWNKAGLLPLARKVTWIDFAFILFYIGVLVTLSNLQIRKESSIALNALLRAIFFFAVLAGLLDVAENVLLLYDMNHAGSTNYISTVVISSIKFILAGSAVLVWLISFIKSKIS